MPWPFEIPDTERRHAFWLSLIRATIATSKWWLDFVRNLIVVSVLVWFAGRSDIWYLSFIAYLTLGALIVFVYASVMSLFAGVPRIGEPIGRPIVLLAAIVSGALVSAALYGASGRLIEIVAEIARLQTR